MYYGLGQVTEFNYSPYLSSNIATDGKMGYLSTFGEAWGLMPDQYAVAFLDKYVCAVYISRVTQTLTLSLSDTHFEKLPTCHMTAL